MLQYVNLKLVAWVMRKFKRFKGHKTKACQFINWLVSERVDLFVHWSIGMPGTSA